MEGSIQRDQMDAKIRELENNLRRLGGHVAGPQTDQVQAIISGFRSKKWLAVFIVVVLAIIVLGSFTSALQNIQTFFKSFFFPAGN